MTAARWPTCLIEPAIGDCRRRFDLRLTVGCLYDGVVGKRFAEINAYFTTKKCRMIHYTCDRCRRRIDTDTEVRYSVEIEMKAVFEDHGHFDSDQYQSDDDADHLMELHEILERLDDDEAVPTRAPEPRQCHFDLCSDCYKAYCRNPLARDMPVSIQFSEN